MKINSITQCISLLLLLFVVTTASAQETLTIEPKPTLKISGTSSLHDWEMISNTATGKLVAVMDGAKIEKINSLIIEMPAESIKSGKSGMDKNAYKALNTSQYKTVKFELKLATKTTTGWTLKGNFTIAGVTKEANIAVKETATAGKNTLSGDYSFKLTDYKITPPTALLGTVKTGDAVKISFVINFK
ncbi:YceI family protein [Flavobacterium psychrotrophum]|uniref:YceI family protein n=1 Tax=Flavobacterium psychrotrophum TaxID=2294119 RepID=UPI000E3173A9|nr:YceI family protein [Flavobacterium psychrotrophum]